MRKDGGFMKRIEFNCYDDLVGTMQTLIACSSEDEYKVISVIAHYDVIKKLLEELILYGEEIGGIIELANSEYTNYNKEYLLYLTEDGITVEKLWCDEDGQKEPHYFSSCGDVVFLHEDCNSKIVDTIESSVILEFGFDEDDLDECACSYDGELEWADCPCCCECEEKCDCHEVVDEKANSIAEPSDKTNTDIAERHEEQYFVNGKSVSKDEYEYYKKVFDDKMTEMFKEFWSNRLFNEISNWKIW